jgi:fibronectin-binding autotransporter adhesin
MSSRLVLSCALFAMGAVVSPAATVIWIVDSGDWGLATNWDTMTVPGSADDAIVGSNRTATIQSSVPTVSSVQVGASSGMGTVIVAGGASISTTTSFVIGHDGGTGDVTIDGGAVTATAATGTSFRVGESGSGTLKVQNSGSLTVNGGDFRLGNGAANSGTLNLATGGTITFGAGVTDVYFGIEGGNVSVFEQTGGTLTRTTGGNTRFGAFGSTGIYNLSGGTATLTSIQVGFAGGGNGTINHTGGTLMNLGEMAIGWDGALGTYNLSGSGVLTTNNRLRIGVNTPSAFGVPSASMIQSGGTANISGRVDIGEGGSNTGAYTISDGALSVTGQGIIFVGAFGGGNGIFTQTGGTVTVADAVIAGFQSGSHGVIGLNGGTLNAQRIQLGQGTGELSFDGGKVVATADNGSFIGGFLEAVLDNGGATIDSNGHTIGVSTALSGPGGLRKTGAGMLTLAGANTFAGGTTVTAGTLVASSLGAGDVTIADAAVLSLSLANALGDAADISLFGTTSQLSLDFLGADTIGSLFVGGGFVAPGTYSAADLNAVYAGQFAGTGSLIISAPEPASGIMLFGGFAGLLGRRRRRS